jgi:hypothetical protein
MQENRKIPAVYFDLVTIPLDPERPRIKIGRTDEHEKRRNSHAKSKMGVVFNVEHLCVIRGTMADEQHILDYFKEHLIPGERETVWPHADVVDYIRWLRDQWFVWVPDDPQCPKIENYQIPDSNLWMPMSERRKSPPRQNGLFNDFGPLKLPPRELTVDDFYTNEKIIEVARKTLGNIDLDPASHAVANRVVQADRFFTANENGLEKKWSGRVWLNPPFSQWKMWVAKIVKEWRSGDIESMCVLCATRTLTAQYFSELHENCTALCIMYGRIPFWGGRAGDSPDDGHAVFYFGNDYEVFDENFSEIGSVYIKSKGRCYAQEDPRAVDA